MQRIIQIYLIGPLLGTEMNPREAMHVQDIYIPGNMGSSIGIKGCKSLGVETFDF